MSDYQKGDLVFGLLNIKQFVEEPNHRLIPLRSRFPNHLEASWNGPSLQFGPTSLNRPKKIIIIEGFFINQVFFLKINHYFNYVLLNLKITNIFNPTF